MDIIINVATDFSKNIGGRYKRDGVYSGEEFRETILIPKVQEALKKNQNIIINLDGGYGYPASFLNEAFGGLMSQFKNPKLLDMIQIVSEDEPVLVLDIQRYMEIALQNN